MNSRTQRLLLAGLLLLSTVKSARAQPVELTLSPAEEPRPALRYRFLPISSELNPGDAAPMYLRLRHELMEESWKQIQEKDDAWSPETLEKIPLPEARKFVDQWSGRIALLRIGARRQFCDWSYPLAEQRQEIIEVLLPDCQSMRQWARLLKIKARVEIAERANDQAIDTIETGIAMGRHVGQGPFVINTLVGIAICSVMLDRVEELVSQPGAPNLYWALSALPRPLVSMRESLETEQRVGENMVPELAMTDEPHSRVEWGILLEKLYDRLRHLAERITSDPKVNTKLRSQLDLDLASFKKENLVPSQEYLRKLGHMDPLKVRAMSDDEAVARALVCQYRDLRDDHFKLAYLPWPEARELINRSDQRLKSVKAGPLAVLAELEPPLGCVEAQMRLDRRVVALRVVEAIRLYAASHDGTLPENLKQITEVPVPDDPATGKPLEYHRDGAAAVLSLPDAHMSGRPPAPYRLTIRKRTNEKKP